MRVVAWCANINITNFSRDLTLSVFVLLTLINPRCPFSMGTSKEEETSWESCSFTRRHHHRRRRWWYRRHRLPTVCCSYPAWSCDRGRSVHVDCYCSYIYYHKAYTWEFQADREYNGRVAWGSPCVWTDACTTGTHTCVLPCHGPWSTLDPALKRHAALSLMASCCRKYLWLYVVP